MELKVLKKTKNELRLEIMGEGHTFCNLLQSALLEDKNVEIAGYDVPHPLVPSAIIYLRTNNDFSPQKALESALSRLRQTTKEFQEKFATAKSA